MIPTVTTIAGLYDTDPAAAAEGDIWWFDGDSWVHVPIGDVSTDDLDAILNRGNESDAAIHAAALTTKGTQSEHYAGLETVDNRPSLQAFGGSTIYVTSDDELTVALEVGTSNRYARLLVYKATGDAALVCTGNLSLAPGGGYVDCTQAVMLNASMTVAQLPDELAPDRFLYHSTNVNKLTYRLGETFHRLHS